MSRCLIYKVHTALSGGSLSYHTVFVLSRTFFRFFNLFSFSQTPRRAAPYFARRLSRRLAYCSTSCSLCQELFSGIFRIFSAELCQFSRVFRLFSLGTLLRQYLSAQDGPGLRRRMFSGHAVGEGLAIPVFRFAEICLRRCRGGSQTRPLFFGMASFHAERNPSETWREGQAPPLRHNRKNILSQRAGVAYPPVHGPPPSSVVECF